MIAALFVAPIGIVHAGAALLTPSLIPIAIGVAILSTALPYTLEMISLTRMPARTFGRSEEHTSELQSLMRISYAVFCLKKKKKSQKTHKSKYITNDNIQ